MPPEEVWHIAADHGRKVPTKQFPGNSQSVLVAPSASRANPYERVANHRMQRDSKAFEELAANSFGGDIERFVYLNGEYYDSYLASEGGYQVFWSNGRKGLISYTRLGKQILVRGGLIAPPEHRAELLREFLDFADRAKYVAHFVGIGETDLTTFRQFGFQVTKFGEEPIVDLKDCTWSGKSFEWVRRQTNFGARNGLRIAEVDLQSLSPLEWSQLHAELREVAALSLSTKAQRIAMPFLEGQIDDHPLGFRRLFTARCDSGDGRIEGFLVCNPMVGGARWSTEMYRHRPDSIRGTVACLFHAAMKQLQTEGVAEVRMCLEPGLRLSPGVPGESRLVRLAFGVTNRFFGSLFDMPGQHHFKSRFRPRYEPRYVCSRPGLSLSSIWAFLWILGLFDIHVGKLTRILIDRFRKRSARGTLAPIH